MAGFLLDFWPVIIFVLLLLSGILWISRKQMGSYGRHVAEVKAINDEIVAINRQVIAELREIKQILKDRN